MHGALGILGASVVSAMAQPTPLWLIVPILVFLLAVLLGAALCGLLLPLPKVLALFRAPCLLASLRDLPLLTGMLDFGSCTIGLFLNQL